MPVSEPTAVVAAACDGACSGNPGPGGWGCLLRFADGSVREMGGADPATTNNRMELTAALALLQELKTLPLAPDLVIRTDSRYLIDGLQKWLPGWKRKGWRTASGGPVLNRDLWEQLDAARLPGLTLRHVRGHSGDPDNDRCDEIAVAFARGTDPALVNGVRPPVPDRAEAPPELTQLLGRLELADRLAAGSYTLNLAELARLVEMPVGTLAEREGSWRWRDWRVEPADAGRWRLVRGTGE